MGCQGRRDSRAAVFLWCSVFRTLTSSRGLRSGSSRTIRVRWPAIFGGNQDNLHPFETAGPPLLQWGEHSRGFRDVVVQTMRFFCLALLGHISSPTSQTFSFKLLGCRRRRRKISRRLQILSILTLLTICLSLTTLLSCRWLNYLMQLKHAHLHRVVVGTFCWIVSFFNFKL